MLVVQPLDPQGKNKGAPLVACDVVRAGPGDHVFCVSSREATHAMPIPFVPVDAAIVGIVDQVQNESLK